MGCNASQPAAVVDPSTGKTQETLACGTPKYTADGKLRDPNNRLPNGKLRWQPGDDVSELSELSTISDLSDL